MIHHRFELFQLSDLLTLMTRPTSGWLAARFGQHPHCKRPISRTIQKRTGDLFASLLLFLLLVRFLFLFFLFWSINLTKALWGPSDGQWNGWGWWDREFGANIKTIWCLATVTETRAVALLRCLPCSCHNPEVVAEAATEPRFGQTNEPFGRTNHDPYSMHALVNSLVRARVHVIPIDHSSSSPSSSCSCSAMFKPFIRTASITMDSHYARLILSSCLSMRFLPQKNLTFIFFFFFFCKLKSHRFSLTTIVSSSFSSSFVSSNHERFNQTKRHFAISLLPGTHTQIPSFRSRLLLARLMRRQTNWVGN